jgi:hypothetical protein
MHEEMLKLMSAAAEPNDRLRRQPRTVDPPADGWYAPCTSYSSIHGGSHAESSFTTNDAKEVDNR